MDRNIAQDQFEEFFLEENELQKKNKNERKRNKKTHKRDDYYSDYNSEDLEKY